jgi:hypothetical protein
MYYSTEQLAISLEQVCCIAYNMNAFDHLTSVINAESATTPNNAGGVKEQAHLQQ